MLLFPNTSHPAPVRCKLEGWLSHKAAWPQPAGCGKGWDRDEMHGGARRQSINHSLVRQRVMSRYSFFSVPFAFALGGKKEIKKKKQTENVGGSLWSCKPCMPPYEGTSFLSPGVEQLHVTNCTYPYNESGNWKENIRSYDSKNTGNQPFPSKQKRLEGQTTL